MKKNIFAITCTILSLAMILTVVSFAFAYPNTVSDLLKEKRPQRNLETVAISDENGEIIYVPKNRNKELNEENAIIEESIEELEIANIPTQIMLDVAEDQPSWVQLSGEVLILHVHSEEDGKFLSKTFEIPQYIYDEMKAMGWKFKQQREFLMKVNIGQIDIGLAWDLFVSGKTAEEIIALYYQNIELIETLSSQYLDDEITLDQYVEQYPFALEKKTIDEVRQEIVDIREHMEQRLIVNSGLSEANIAFCKDNGINSVKDMARAKYIADSIQSEFNQVVLTKKKSVDWDDAEAKLTGKTYEEIKSKNASGMSNDEKAFNTTSGIIKEEVSYE